MGNSQSAADKDAANGQNESQNDSRLRRFHTGASDATTSATSPSPTPPLRRTSTTATGTASEKRHASLGRAGSSASAYMRMSGTDGASSAARRASGTVSATGSPRASEREKAWVRSATRRNTNAAPGEGAPSQTRERSRSSSIGLLLSGGGGSRSRGPTLHEDQIYDPHQDAGRRDGGRRAELTFRRRKSIELTDVEPSMTKGLPMKHATRTDQSSQIAGLLSSSPPSIIGQHSMAEDDTDDPSPSEAGATQTSTADVYNPLFPPTRRPSKDPLGRSQPAAFPSYLKIPTLIPSTYASPTSSGPSSPSTYEPKGWPVEDASSVTTPSAAAFPHKLGGGGTAAAAILNVEDVVIKPGGASKASTPTEEHVVPHTEAPGEAEAVAIEAGSDAGKNHAADDNIAGGPSRTPTPTPGNLRGARAMTPNDRGAASINTVTSDPSSESTTTGTVSSLKATPHAGDSSPAASAPTPRRPSLQMYTGSESGANTPGLPSLPIGLTSTPSSVLTPTAIAPSVAEERAGQAGSTQADSAADTPTGTAPSQRTPVESQSRGSSVMTTRQATGTKVPLMPIEVRWRAGGREVFVTGTFANEWRSKILLKKVPGTSGKRTEYSCVLHLAPGTHRLKFIVDDRWRVSRDLSTASDGEGNLTNYIEVAHMGPAHPGPLSAPGEDLPVTEEEEKRRAVKQAPGLSGHKATLDLLEEARRAEALRRGDLVDVFGEDKVRKEDKWTQEIPDSIIKAQAAEEAYRNELETQADVKQGSRRDSAISSEVPLPPALPRQLEKVILNSSPAVVAGGVDDNSVLPAPNHAVLHHLTASAIKSGVIATGCTMRYRKKYITTIYYRAAN